MPTTENTIRGLFAEKGHSRYATEVLDALAHCFGKYGVATKTDLVAHKWTEKRVFEVFQLADHLAARRLNNFVRDKVIEDLSGIGAVVMNFIILFKFHKHQAPVTSKCCQ